MNRVLAVVERNIKNVVDNKRGGVIATIRYD